MSSRQTKTHGRSIVVDGIPYRWIISSRRIRIRTGDRGAPGFDMPRPRYEDPVTPGLVSAWIKENVPGHPAVTVVSGDDAREARNHGDRIEDGKPEALVSGTPVPGQPSVYALVQVSRWHDDDAGEDRESRTAVACYLDPARALETSRRLDGGSSGFLALAKRIEAGADDMQEAARLCGGTPMRWMDAFEETMRREGVAESAMQALLAATRGVETAWEVAEIPLLLEGVPSAVLDGVSRKGDSGLDG